MARGIDWGEVELLVTELDPTDPLLDPYRGIVDIR